MARFVVDKVSQKYKDKLKMLSIKTNRTLRKVVLDALDKVEGLNE